MIGLGLALISPGSQASAQTSWTIAVPDGCGDEAQARAGLSRLIGDSAEHSEPIALHIVAAAGEYQLSLSVGAEQRSLRDTDCSALFRSALVVAALAIDPDAAVANAPAQGAPEPEPATAASVNTRVPAAEKESSVPDPSQSPAEWSMRVSLGGGPAYGLLPVLVPQLELEAGAAHGWLGVALGARYAPPSEARAKDGFGVELYAVSTSVAAELQPVRWVRFVSGVEARMLNGRGNGTPASTRDSAFGIGLRAGAVVIPARLDPLSLELGVFGSWAAVRPRFVIRDYGEIYQTARWGAEASARLAWRFF